MDRGAVRSTIREAESYAAESQLFIDYVRQGRATPHYAQEHAGYLQDAVEHSRRELERDVAQQDSQEAFDVCRSQLTLLAAELGSIRAAIGNKDALAAAQPHIAAIRDRLHKAGTDL